MLNDEVIQAITDGMFNIYEVNTIEEGITILTGMPAGTLNENNEYEEGSVYRKVTDKLKTFSEIAQKKNN